MWYEAMIAFGHSPFTAKQIELDVSRNDPYAIAWVKSAASKMDVCGLTDEVGRTRTR